MFRFSKTVMKGSQIVLLQGIVAIQLSTLQKAGMEKLQQKHKVVQTRLGALENMGK